MPKTAFFLRLLTATGTLVFSMNVTALPPNEVLSTKVSTIKTPATLLAATLAAKKPNCIADNVITAAELSATRDNGPFSVAKKQVPRQLANGFGGGTIHYPTNAVGCGLLGAIAVIPGYVSYESSIKWWGPRLASWGFVAITINTNSIYDNPDSRAAQLSAALDHMINDPTVGGQIDSNRLGAIGWSMGGGGTLRLATERSAVRAIIPQTAYHDKNYGDMNTPALFISCQNDRIASNRKHSNVFYNDASGPKMKIEIKNGSHFCPSFRFNEILLSKPGIAFMHRHINNDTRFDKFLCNKENYSNSPRISAYDYENCL